MTDPKQNRFAARYARRRAAGDTLRPIWFTQAASAVLRDLQARWPDKTVEQIVAEALLNASVNG